MVFDLTKKSSFIKVRDWLNEARVNGHANINFLLVGNKCDDSSEREVSTNEAQDFAFGEGFNYIETSAKNNLNVEKAFVELSYRVLEKINRGQILVDADGSNGVKAGGAKGANKNVMNSSQILAQDYNHPPTQKEKGCCE